MPVRSNQEFLAKTENCYCHWKEGLQVAVGWKRLYKHQKAVRFCSSFPVDVTERRNSSGI